MGGNPNPVAFNPRETGSDYFWYSHTAISTLVSTAPNATALINIDADSDFYCTALTMAASIANAVLTDATDVVPLVTLQITDTGSGKSLMNTPIQMDSILGRGRLPYRLNRPRVFMANATIQLSFVATVAAGTTYSNLQVVFHGYKVYR